MSADTIAFTDIMGTLQTLTFQEKIRVISAVSDSMDQDLSHIAGRMLAIPAQFNGPAMVSSVPSNGRLSRAGMASAYSDDQREAPGADLFEQTRHSLNRD